MKRSKKEIIEELTRSMYFEKQMKISEEESKFHWRRRAIAAENSERGTAPRNIIEGILNIINKETDIRIARDKIQEFLKHHKAFR